jgi:hypothetical protein
MDAFRERWSQVELDLVSGFHADPVALLGENRADLYYQFPHGKACWYGVSSASYEVLALLSTATRFRAGHISQRGTSRTRYCNRTGFLMSVSTWSVMFSDPQA